MKEQALKLADEIDGFGKEADIQTSKTHGDYHRNVADMIRKLVAELDNKSTQTRVKYGNPDTLETGWITIETPQTKLLSDEEIDDLVDNCGAIWTGDFYRIEPTDLTKLVRDVIKKVNKK